MMEGNKSFCKPQTMPNDSSEISVLIRGKSGFGQTSSSLPWKLMRPDVRQKPQLLLSKVQVLQASADHWAPQNLSLFLYKSIPFALHLQTSLGSVKLITLVILFLKLNSQLLCFLKTFQRNLYIPKPHLPISKLCRYYQPIYLSVYLTLESTTRR